MALLGLRLYYGLLDAVRRRRSIVVYYAWPDFAKKSEALADLLRRQGFSVVVRSGHSFFARAKVKLSSDLHIGFWNEYPLASMPQRYIFYNAEPLSVSHWRDRGEWHEAMRGALQVWGYVNNHTQYVTSLGVPYRHVPFGYAPYYEARYRAHTEGKRLDADIDVLFVGRLSERRQAVVDRLRASAINVHTVTYLNPAYDAALDELLARSRIILGIHSYANPEAHIVDFARIDYLLSNRRFVIHERPSEAARDLEFEDHVVTCEHHEFAERCAHFLARPADRIRIAEASYEWFKTKRALTDSLPYSEIRRLLNIEGGTQPSGN